MIDDEGPYFDDLEIGDVFATAPAVTLTSGRAAVHQSIIGSRLRLSLDDDLATRVAGAPLADPALVWDTAIGQSTLVTRRVVANLFYRGLLFHRLPAVGDTLRTVTEVVGLRQNATRPSGLVALRITTVDQQDRVVLDFWRCAMIPLRSAETVTGRSDDLSAIGSPVDTADLNRQIGTWAIDAFPTAQRIRYEPGQSWAVRGGDLVSNATELARLTMNLAHIHHDRFAQPTGRLVYGGHTIGLALAQVTRTLPDLVTVAGWHSCDHTGPVREGDTLVSTIAVEKIEPFGDRLQMLTLRVVVAARHDSGETPVLDWVLLALSR